MGIQLKLVERKQWGEYEVRWIEDGKVIEDKSYFTDDKDDAVETMAIMKKSINMRQSPKSSMEKTNMVDGIINRLAEDNVYGWDHEYWKTLKRNLGKLNGATLEALHMVTFYGLRS